MLNIQHFKVLIFTLVKWNDITQDCFEYERRLSLKNSRLMITWQESFLVPTMLWLHSCFWVIQVSLLGSLHSSQHKEVRRVLRKSHTYSHVSLTCSGITSPQLPFPIYCFCRNTRSFQVGWPHIGRALIWYGGFTYYMFRFSSRGENFVLSRILFSFKSWLGRCSCWPFSHFPYLLVCSFQYSTFFGEHFLEGGSNDCVKAPKQIRGHCFVKWGDWLILPMGGLVPRGWQERELTGDQK